MKLTGALGKHQRGLTVGSFGMEVRTMADQRLDGILAPVLHSEHQGGHTIGSSCINVSALHQRFV
jgi:hypothetical protein